MNSKLKIGLLVIFGVFFALFNTPLIAIPKGTIAGLPTIMMYLVGCWIILIILMRMISGKMEGGKEK